MLRTSRGSNARASGGVPESSASSITARSAGRGKLPVCVVRMRSLLRFMIVSPPWSNW